MSDIITWNVQPDVAWGNLVQAQVDAIEADIVALVDGMTDQVAQWMRDNHRWTNRSGDAEAGLYADIEHVARTSVHLLISHGPAIEYAWILELNPRTALLGDTLDVWWPVLYQGILEIMRRHSS